YVFFCADYANKDGRCLLNTPNIKIESFVSKPSLVNAGGPVSFTVRLKNYGGVKGTVKIEGALLPTTWDSSSLNFTSEYYVNSPECCPANKYYDAKEVTLSPLQTEDVTFTIIAPTKTTVDECDYTYPTRSAWGSSFIYKAGIYKQCGDGYTDYLDVTGPTICTYDPICTVKDKDCINSDTAVQNWYMSTLCDGGCGDWIKGSSEDCSSGYYCTDPGIAYCKKCSISCDKICQSSACYGTDPDCASDGSLKDCEDSGPCDGKITTIVKDNKGNGIQGIRVYLDNTYKGTTDSAGRQTSSTSDSSCGISHNIKVYCSDGTYCGSGSTTINYDNDYDDIIFNCQVCMP
ncbi:MAG: hypothetical protein KAR23_02825, partial [Candidatus Aenigmarchaeota archaeon]|nr:hypothetical protein [Candidatus Aenigmarchaeota archaeon]